MVKHPWFVVAIVLSVVSALSAAAPQCGSCSAGSDSRAPWRAGDGAAWAAACCAETTRGEAPKATAAMPRLEVDMHDGLLTVRLYDAPWNAVLPELEQRTGVQIIAPHPLSGVATLAFERWPLEQGLRRLFRQANFLFVYAHGGQEGTAAAPLRRVWVFPKEGNAAEPQPRLNASGEPPPRAPEERLDAALKAEAAVVSEEEPAPEGALTAEPAQEAALERLRAEARQEEVEALRSAISTMPGDDDVMVKRDAIQALAEREGSEVTTSLRLALRDADPAIRMSVLENLLATAEGSPLLQEALTDADPAVRPFADYWLAQGRER